MPEYKFLGVRGGYDHQHMEMGIPNLEYVVQHPEHPGYTTENTHSADAVQLRKRLGANRG